jgi:hypothetical protein
LLVKEAAYLTTVHTIATGPQGLTFAFQPDRSVVISAIKTYNSLVTQSDILDADAFPVQAQALRQRDATTAIHKRRFDALLQDRELDNDDRCRIMEQTLPGASSWMIPIRAFQMHVITDLGFRLLLLRHLGCDFFEDDNAINPLCPRVMAKSTYDRRVCKKPLGCRLYHTTDLCKTTFSQRHNSLVACFSKLCTFAGIAHMREVACIPNSNSVPADLYLHEGPSGKPMAVDMVVSTPLCVDGRPVPGSVMRLREKHKLSLYAAAFESIGGFVDFLPFAASSFGGIGKHAKILVAFVASKLASAWYMSPQSARAYVMAHLMTSIMAGNALLLSQAVSSVSLLSDRSQ